MARVETFKKSKITGKAIWIGLIASILLVASAIYFLLYPFASKEKSVYFKGKNPILFKGEQDGNALIEEKTLFVPLTFLKKNIDPNVVYDEKSKSVIITTADKVVQMPTDSLTYFINQKPVKIQLSPILVRNGEIYVAIDPILTYYSINYQILSGTGAIWIQQDGLEYVNGRLVNKDVNEEKIRLRTGPSWDDPYTAQLKPGEAVTIEGQKNEFYLVRNSQGIGGYVKKEFIEKGQPAKIKIAREAKTFTMPKLNGPVSLTWEAVYSKNPNPAMIPEMSGVNVVSPTWFSLADASGNVRNLASLDYSKWAQSKGYQVWGLFTNSFDPKLTHEALKDFETRQTIIRELLQYSKMYRLQGINFDIENVNPEDGPLVTQFMREAAPYLHEAGLIVSMDITFKAGDNNNWSSFYDRPQLSQIVDYLMVMAYDEHWGPDSGAGSVSSLPWVEKNLQTLLTEVPSQKLILGVPLYARLWKEQQKEDGTIDVTAKALSMNQVKTWLAEKNVKPAYDDNSGQNYAEFYATDEKATYKIWIEDELSLRKRVDLVQKYKLAGVGTWSRFFADQTAWTALNINPDQSLTKK